MNPTVKKIGYAFMASLAQAIVEGSLSYIDRSNKRIKYNRHITHQNARRRGFDSK